MVPLARHRRPPALRRPLLGLLCVLCGSVLSLVRGDSDFSQLRPRFPLATRAERARATFPSVFTFEGRERVQGLSPWCIRVRSEDDFSAAGEDEPHTLRCLPSWQVVGVYKCGTTDLFEKLVMHGEVNPGGFSYKEPHYFDNGMPTAKEPAGGPATRRVLHRFRVEADYLKRGLDSGRDVSRCTFGAADPDNLYGGRVIGSQAAARKVTRQEMIVESLPEARLIAILRDPVSRAFSQFRYVRNPRDHNVDEFHRLVEGAVRQFSPCLEPPSCACFWNDVSPATSGTSLLRSSMYWCGVREMLAQLGDDRDRLMLLQTEAYKQEPKRELGRLFNHLGVREPTQDEWQAMLKADAANQHSSKLRMREDTRQLLLKTFAPFNKALFDAVPELDPSLWQSS